ncbi:Arm DNA-binding domain-containing protein [Bosea rubneri]|uniref:Arm DNA-binding domain-containing protein n=1 Tax=Bosea rubneri TaxID=3075434 RepID=UPI0036F4161E
MEIELLADAQIRRAQPTEKLTKMSDGGGFNLQLNPNGSKLWWIKYPVCWQGEAALVRQVTRGDTGPGPRKAR